MESLTTTATTKAYAWLLVTEACNWAAPIWGGIVTLFFGLLVAVLSAWLLVKAWGDKDAKKDLIRDLVQAVITLILALILISYGLIVSSFSIYRKQAQKIMEQDAALKVKPKEIKKTVYIIPRTSQETAAALAQKKEIRDTLAAEVEIGQQIFKRHEDAYRFGKTGPDDLKPIFDDFGAWWIRNINYLGNIEKSLVVRFKCGKELPDIPMMFQNTEALQKIMEDYQ